MSVATAMARISAIQGQLATLGVPTASPTGSDATAAAGFSDTLDQTLGTTSSSVERGRRRADALRRHDRRRRRTSRASSPALLKAVVKVESGFDPNSTSSAGAKGLTQLMPETAAGLGITNPYDPMQSLRGGARELAGALKTFNGDVRLALAAYNAGVGAVKSTAASRRTPRRRPTCRRCSSTPPSTRRRRPRRCRSSGMLRRGRPASAARSCGRACATSARPTSGAASRRRRASTAPASPSTSTARTGVSIPRTSEEQFRAGTPVAANALQPGDLVFFQKNGDVHHVGIYVGGGRFLQAPHTGDVVKISSLSEPYYASRFCGARRYG